MEHLINLNFAPGGLPATVHVSQYDDTIRQLRFQLWFGRSKVEVPSGASVRVDIKKPDGHIVLVNGTVNSSDRSIVTVPTTKQMTAVPGGSRGTLVISSTGDKRISSAIFILQVHRDPVEDGDASDSDLSMLQDAIDQTAANASAAQAAATAAQQAAESFTVDSTLNSTSTNAIQNKAVAAGFAAINESLGDVRVDLATLADVTPIPDNSDLNDYVNTGLYTIEIGDYTILHYPMDTVVASYLEVTALTTGYIAQKLTQAGSGKVFTRRRYSNGNWNEWIQIAEISNDLMTQGKAADSKKTGDAISALRAELSTLDTGLSYAEKSRILYLLENANYKSETVKENLEELREMFGVINVPYMHVLGTTTKKRADESVHFGIMELNSITNSKRGILVSTSGDHKLVYDDGTESPYYPIQIPKGVKYVTWLKGIENNLAMTYHVIKWNSQANRWECVCDCDWYYSNLDGSQFYFDVHEWSNGSFYLVSTVLTSNGEREYTTQYPERMYQHGSVKTNLDLPESDLRKLVLEFV